MKYYVKYDKIKLTINKERGDTVMACAKCSIQCPNAGYCKYVTRCYRVNERIRKKLEEQGYYIVYLEQYRDLEQRADYEKVLKSLGYKLIDEEKKIWRLDLEQSLIELDIFEMRQNCPKINL